jgi:hypothetical protein
MTRRRWFWLVAAALAAYPAMVFAADIELPELRKPAPATTSILAPPDATCLEWTDGCRTCQKPATGEAACSNVGISCQPQVLRCVRQPEK